jgi:hypothetical protein
LREIFFTSFNGFYLTLTVLNEMLTNFNEIASSTKSFVDPVEKLQLLCPRLSYSIKVLASVMVTMGTRPEDVEAQARREGGLTRALQVDRAEPPCPSRGGSRGFDCWFRTADLLRFENDERITASLSSTVGRMAWSESDRQGTKSGNISLEYTKSTLLFFSFP